MTPTEFVLWFNGAAGLLGDVPPTPEQWATMREKMGEAIGKLTADRLLERVDEQIRQEAEKMRVHEEIMKLKAEPARQMSAMLAKTQDEMVFKTLSGIEDYRNRIVGYAQTVTGGTAPLTSGAIVELPDAPTLTPPTLFNRRIMGKKT